MPGKVFNFCILLQYTTLGKSSNLVEDLQYKTFLDVWQRPVVDVGAGGDEQRQVRPCHAARARGTSTPASHDPARSLGRQDPMDTACRGFDDIDRDDLQG